MSPSATTTARARAAGITPEPARDARDVLVPRGREIRLTDGTVITVRPWSIRVLIEVSQRLPELMQAALTGTRKEASVVELLPKAMEAMTWLTALTLGIGIDEVERVLTGEDLIAVSDAIYDECIAPVSSKFEGLVLKMLKVAPASAARAASASPQRTQAAPSPAPSST